MENKLKYSFILLFLLVLGIVAVYGVPWKGRPKSAEPQLKGIIVPSQSDAQITQQLLGTSWTALDSQGQPEADEYSFQTTKLIDPAKQLYDFQEYINSKPGETGYWKIQNGQLTIYSGGPGEQTVYTKVEISKTSLVLSYGTENGATVEKFRKIVTENPR